MEISIQNVSMTYPNGKQALKDLNLDLRSPSLIGLLGPNGAGKSTLMKLLVAALLPTSGSILVDGQPLAKGERQLKARLGYLPQDFGYYPNFTGLDFLLYLSALKGLDRRGAEARSRELLELVGLGTNVGCYGSILPSVENTQILVELRDFLNEKYGFHIKTLSGGSTCTLKLLEEGRLVGELRPGETGLHAVQSALGRLYPGLQVRQDRESGRLFCAME